MMFAVDWNICYNHALIAFIFFRKKVEKKKKHVKGWKLNKSLLSL